MWYEGSHAMALKSAWRDGKEAGSHICGVSECAQLLDLVRLHCLHSI